MNPIEMLSKPQFVLRPKQILRRLWREYRKPADPILETELPWGVRIRINSSEIIGKNIWHQGLYDHIVCEALYRLIVEGDTVIDAGSNIGQMTGIMALRVGRTGRVMAFEPHPAIFQDLKHNIGLIAERLSMENVEAFEVALSDSEGEASLLVGSYFPFNQGTAHLGAEGPNAGGTPVPVQKRTLDSFIGDKTISVLKIDVEGHEKYALAGAARSLEKGLIRTILYEDFGAQKAEIGHFLSKFGYERFALGGSLKGPELSDPSRNPRVRAYDAPNYLATLEPENVSSRLKERGWRIFD